MRISDEALVLAKLQRTAMNKQQIVNSYKRDYKDVIDHGGILNVNKILDIGCGIAGWECFVPRNMKIYLLDKTEVAKKIYYGYKPKTAFYNSMQVAKENLILNGIKEEDINIQEANNNNLILFDEKFDLVVSFISCGFHYPVETYLDQIYDKLREGGVLIIDIRKGSNGQDKLFDKFGHKRVIIKEEKKYWRIKCTKLK